jgi:hypothetical protein
MWLLILSRVASSKAPSSWFLWRPWSAGGVIICPFNSAAHHVQGRLVTR